MGKGNKNVAMRDTLYFCWKFVSFIGSQISSWVFIISFILSFLYCFSSRNGRHLQAIGQYKNCAGSSEFIWRRWDIFFFCFLLQWDVRIYNLFRIFFSFLILLQTMKGWKYGIGGATFLTHYCTKTFFRRTRKNKTSVFLYFYYYFF